MAVGSCFDQWQKDVFFSAAEEVQESVDVMQSIYRMWMRGRSDGLESDVSDELRRELHMALGTAKWQLEEFERAVNSSYVNYSTDESVNTRHNQFIAAIESQISCVEKALSNSLIEEGKQPLRWVQLDEEERDDLAAFLSAAPKTSLGTKDNNNANHEGIRGFKGTLTINKDAKYIVEVEAKECVRGKEEVSAQGDMLTGQRRISISQDMDAWKIAIADEENVLRRSIEASKAPSRPSSLRGFLTNIESTARSKWFRNSFPKVKSGVDRQSKQGAGSQKGFNRLSQGLNRLTDRGFSCSPENTQSDAKVSNVQQLIGRVSGLRKHVQDSEHSLLYGRSFRVALLILLSVFLIVPMVRYST